MDRRVLWGGITMLIWHNTDTWPIASWYAYCLGYPRDASAAGLESQLFNYACREGIVFG
jgi:hypothetical protein